MFATTDVWRPRGTTYAKYKTNINTSDPKRRITLLDSLLQKKQSTVENRLDI